MQTASDNFDDFDNVDDEFMDGVLSGTLLQMPIIKSRPQSDGRIKVVGLASDASPDLEGEVILAERNPSCIRTINAGRACFDFEHNSVLKDGPIVGRPTAARFISNDEARRKYPEVQAWGNPLEIEGYINPLGKKPPKDLQNLHHYIEIGENLFFSIWDPTSCPRTVEVVNGKRVRAAVPNNILRIAISAQGINGNAVCHIAKSVSAALALRGPMVVEEAEMDRSRPRLIVVSRSLSTPVQSTPISKALTSDSGVAVDGTSGGEALKTESLAGRLANGELRAGAKKDVQDAKVQDAKTCDCGAPIEGDGAKCEQCRADAEKADDDSDRGISKALQSGLSTLRALVA